jgi:hypothetical protein
MTNIFNALARLNLAPSSASKTTVEIPAYCSSKVEKSSLSQGEICALRNAALNGGPAHPDTAPLPEPEEAGAHVFGILAEE